jgi:hypothetical protein
MALMNSTRGMEKTYSIDSRSMTPIGSRRSYVRRLVHQQSDFGTNCRQVTAGDVLRRSGRHSITLSLIACVLLFWWPDKLKYPASDIIGTKLK